jgi:dienelactone hydrolase
VHHKFAPALAALALLSVSPVPVAAAATTPTADAPQPSPYFEQPVADSHPLRIAQAAELEAYIKTTQQDEAALRSLLRPDYSSPAAFAASVAAYRRAFSASIGYPPLGSIPVEAARFDKMGEDSIGTYYRVTIAILPGVHAQGIYIVPQGLTSPAPLVVAIHGGAGSPELALFNGGANYHDMVRGGVKRGYVVFAPQLLFSSPGLPKDLRKTIDERMRLIGTSLTAVESAKIIRSLDLLLQRPEIDPARVGLVGLSYGGYYTLVTAALDLRIKVAVSSCYYGVQEGRYAHDELSVPGDFRFTGRFNLFRDPDLIALICPRALLIQAGDRDTISPPEPGLTLAPVSAGYYDRLGLGERFQHHVFSGKHEFHDASAWAFVARHL